MPIITTTAVDRDYQAELAALNADIADLTEQIKADRFYSLEHRTNTHGKLGTLLSQVPILEWEAEIQDQRLDWIADAARMTGDLLLGGIAYVVFGTQVLPC
ncbi:hypothetical protein ACIQVL_48675 [Streptomyces sp. NPDC090499]|uniref:hypothetical protein n=1 Tax=Streptomyces sp. NPDC090499 TaxID=3365965 RepID=UPI003809241B